MENTDLPKVYQRRIEQMAIIKNKLQKGGLVKGDRVPMVLHAGYSMLSKDVIKKYGKRFIQALNRKDKWQT